MWSGNKKKNKKGEMKQKGKQICTDIAKLNTEAWKKFLASMQLNSDAV